MAIGAGEDELPVAQFLEVPLHRGGVDLAAEVLDQGLLAQLRALVDLVEDPALARVERGSGAVGQQGGRVRSGWRDLVCRRVLSSKSGGLSDVVVEGIPQESSTNDRSTIR